MRGLEIVGAEHQDDQGERGVRFDPLREPVQSVAPRPCGIIQHRGASIEAVFDDAHGVPLRLQRVFHDAGPAGDSQVE